MAGRPTNPLFAGPQFVGAAASPAGPGMLAYEMAKHTAVLTQNTRAMETLARTAQSAADLQAAVTQLLGDVALDPNTGGV